MKCVNDVVIYLSRFMDQDLPAAEVADMVEHLEECLACRMELKRLRTAMVIMKSAEQVAVPRDYAKAVREKMHDKDMRN